MSETAKCADPSLSRRANRKAREFTKIKNSLSAEKYAYIVVIVSHRLDTSHSRTHACTHIHAPRRNAIIRESRQAAVFHDCARARSRNKSKDRELFTAFRPRTRDRNQRGGFKKKGKEKKKDPHTHRRLSCVHTYSSISRLDPNASDAINNTQPCIDTEIHYALLLPPPTARSFFLEVSCRRRHRHRSTPGYIKIMF